MHFCSGGRRSDRRWPRPSHLPSLWGLCKANVSTGCFPPIHPHTHTQTNVQISSGLTRCGFLSNSVWRMNHLFSAGWALWQAVREFTARSQPSSHDQLCIYHNSEHGDTRKLTAEKQPWNFPINFWHQSDSEWWSRSKEITAMTSSVWL